MLRYNNKLKDLELLSQNSSRLPSVTSSNIARYFPAVNSLQTNFILRFDLLHVNLVNFLFVFFAYLKALLLVSVVSFSLIKLCSSLKEKDSIQSLIEVKFSLRIHDLGNKEQKYSEN